MSVYDGLIVQDPVEAIIFDGTNAKFFGCTQEGTITQTVDQSELICGIGSKVKAILNKSKMINFNVQVGLHSSDFIAYNSGVSFTSGSRDIWKNEKIIGVARNAVGTLTFTDSVSDTETVTIGEDVYEFDTDAVASITEGNIRVDVSGGATASDAVTALVAAIGEERDYSAVDGDGDTVVVTYGTAGASGEIDTTTTCADASWGDTTLIAGVTCTITGTPKSDTVYVADVYGKTHTGTYDTSVVTITTGVAGSYYNIMYQETTANVDQVDLDVDSFPSDLHVQLHTIAYDENADEIIADIYWDFPKAVPDGSIDESFSGDAKVSTIGFKAIDDGTGSYGTYMIIERT